MLFIFIVIVLVQFILLKGTVSLEMVEQVRELLLNKKGKGKSHQDLNLDAVIIPVGGGGLAAGNTIALRGLLGNNVKVGRRFWFCFPITVTMCNYTYGANVCD